MPLCDAFFSRAAAAPERAALIADGAPISYGALAADARRLACGLRALVGDAGAGGEPPRIGLALDNGADFAAIFLACVEAGFVAAPLDPKWTAVEGARVRAAVGLRLVVARDRQASAERCEVASPGRLRAAAAAVDAPARPGSRPASEPFLIAFTSGSGGTPKGVLRSSASWDASLAAAASMFPVSPGQVVFVPGPFVHGVSLFALIEALSAGGTALTLSTFSAERARATLASAAVNRIVATPTILAALGAAPRGGYAAVDTIVSAGAKLSARARTDLSRDFPNARILEYFGATELSFVSAAAAEEGCPDDSVGRLMLGVSVRVRRADGRLADAGEIGRLEVASPMLADAYVCGAAPGAFRLDDGWATVGDLASIDDDGWLRLHGRVERMLISGGLNVFPSEVEAVLRECEAIADAAVFALPDPYWGDRVVAAIRWRDGARRSRADLAAHCRARLPSFKRPKQFFSVDDRWSTTSGKIAVGRLTAALAGADGPPEIAG